MICCCHRRPAFAKTKAVQLTLLVLQQLKEGPAYINERLKVSRHFKAAFCLFFALWLLFCKSASVMQVYLRENHVKASFYVQAVGTLTFFLLYVLTKAY